MALRQIRIQGDPVLEKKCREVKEMTPRLLELVQDMMETMHAESGVGLAAPQVGILRRVFLVDADDRGLLEFINPEILETSGEQDGVEGCLSLPDQWGMVKRPSHVKVRAQDRNGAWFELEADDLAARCICHENDHLNGHLYSEKVYKWLTPEEVEAMFAAQEEEA